MKCLLSILHAASRGIQQWMKRSVTAPPDLPAWGEESLLTPTPRATAASHARRMKRLGEYEILALEKVRHFRSTVMII